MGDGRLTFVERDAMQDGMPKDNSRRDTENRQSGQRDNDDLF
jgi:hypothetical protein